MCYNNNVFYNTVCEKNFFNIVVQINHTSNHHTPIYFKNNTKFLTINIV